MESLLASILLLAVISCGLSVIASGVTGRADAFLFIRPLVRLLTRAPARICRGISRLSSRWARRLWRSGTQTLWLLPFFGLAAFTLAVTSLFFAFLAEVAGEVFKKK